MKRVFSNSDQVIHLWANQSQSDARCGNVDFEGTKIYSYGAHYLLGQIIEHKGVRIAFVNTRGYSVTTAKHINSARYGTRHLIQLDWPLARNLEYDETMIRPALLDEQDRLVNRLMHHFSRVTFWSESKWDEERNEIVSFNSKCHALGYLELALIVNDSFINLHNDHIQYRLARNKELETRRLSPEFIQKRDAAKERAEALLIIKAEQARRDWQAGLINQFPGMSMLDPQMIRIHVLSDAVQTTRGASVPLDTARNFMFHLQNGRLKEGFQVGHFTFNGVKGDIVTIGCHRFSLKSALEVFEQYQNKLNKDLAV